MPGHCPLGTQDTLYRGDHQGDKENEEFTCSPTFPGRPRFPGSPCRTKETRAHGLLSAASQTLALCTPFIWAAKCDSGKICEKQHLTKPTVAWRKKELSYLSKGRILHGANICCSAVKCPKSWSCCSKITFREPHKKHKITML